MTSVARSSAGGRAERSIGPLGSGARVLLGAGLIALAVLAWDLDGAGIVLGLAAFPALLVLVQLVHSRVSGEPLDATGPLGFALNAVLAVLLFSIAATRDAAALFYGASMLLAAARGYSGCEITAISNSLLGRDDQVGCVVLGPIDAIESGARR